MGCPDNDDVIIPESLYEYEICYKCHTNPGFVNLNPKESRINRQFDHIDIRDEFNTGNQSYHPIEGIGKNTNVSSLVSDLTPTSLIYCSDCHGSDDQTAPNGPHGSNYRYILKGNCPAERY